MLSWNKRQIVHDFSPLSSKTKNVLMSLISMFAINEIDKPWFPVSSYYIMWDSWTDPFVLTRIGP